MGGKLRTYPEGLKPRELWVSNYNGEPPKILSERGTYLDWYIKNISLAAIRRMD